MENFQPFNLGMLTANGFPASASTLVGETPHLELVDPIPDQSQATVQWALVGRKLYARGTLGRVTWRALECSNLDTKEGHKVRIEGMEFILRLPKVGADRELSDLTWFGNCWALSWDPFLGEDSFIVRGRIIRNAEENSMMFEAMGYEDRDMDQRMQLIPVLEPIMPDMEALTGLYVSLMTPKGPAEARLLEVTAYDLAFVDYKGQLSDVWGQTKGETTFLNREAVVNIGLAG